MPQAFGFIVALWLTREAFERTMAVAISCITGSIGGMHIRDDNDEMNKILGVWLTIDIHFYWLEAMLELTFFKLD
jgi:hypothetical protein